MRITIDIPKEFEKHFSEDRFRDSLERIKIELCEMLIEAFENAEIRKVGHWVGEGYIDMCCSECGNTPDHEQGMTPEATDFCPNCGAEME